MQVLVIEDDLDVFDIVQLCINARWPEAIVRHGVSGELGLQMARTQEPDIVILDIGLPGIDGFEVCSRIRGFSDVPIVMLTVRHTNEDIARGLQLGADDYIAKPFRPSDFVARVNAVLRRLRMTYLREAEMAFRQDDLSINFYHGEVRANTEPIKLAPTEYQLFYHLIQDAGRVVASQTLIDHIWGREYRSSPFFLSSSIARLRNTLHGYPQTRNIVLQEEPAGYSLALTAGSAD